MTSSSIDPRGQILSRSLGKAPFMIRSCAVALCGVALLAGCSSSSPQPIACAAPSSICAAKAGAAFCANLATDTSNCGTCGTTCAVPGNGGTTSCIAGACAPTCGGGTKALCNAAGGTSAGLPALSCTDTATDVSNCGGCGKVCPSGQACTSGACVVSTLTACGGATGSLTFKNLQTDHDNCGVCGNACGSSETCVDGDCSACPVSQCANLCVDTLSDNANCGTCGNAVAICENGVAYPATGTFKIALEIGAPASTGFLPKASSVFTQTIKVHSQSTVTSVTVQVDAQAPVAMFLNSPSGVSPSVWTTSLTVPAAATSKLTFVAQDELWLAGRADAADHTATLQTNALTVLAAPAGMPIGFAAATFGVADLTGKWVPLNAGPISLTAAASDANIASIQFLNGTTPIGSSAPGKPLVLAPALVGTGALSLTACEVDLVGQQGTCSAALAMTIGAIPLPNGAAPPVLGKAADGSRSIFFLNAAGNLLGQPFDQISPTPAAPGTQIGSDAFVLGSLAPTPEATGVYALKSDGSAVERFDCGAPTLACSKPTFVMAPAAASFSTIPILTSAAMLLQDANGMPFLARALSSQTTDTAVPAGGAQAFDVSNNPLRGTTKSGAIALGLSSGTSALINLFHPAISSPNHLFTLLPLRANTTLTDLQVFPGGEIVFQFFDTTTQQAWLGAALFDGTNQPQLLAPFAIGPATGGFLATGFLVARPGIVLGQVPASAATNGVQIQPVELSLGVTSQQFSPAVYTVGSMTGTGPLCHGCIEGRSNPATTFSVSDDGAKALFVTSDSNSSVASIHLLDLATGTAPVIGSTSMVGEKLQRNPRFVHTAAVFAGGPATGMVPAVVWSEQLSSATLSDERLSFATWSASGPGPAIPIDRLGAFFNGRRGAHQDAVAESASAQELFFLSQRPQGGADLYSVSLTGTSGVAAKVADRVYWYSVREDKARILVARSDGTLLAAQLTPGVDLAAALQPVLEGGPRGESDYQTNLSSFGFTPDGDHAYLATNQAFTPSSRAFNGLVEVIDLTTGARTNFGRTTWGQQGFATTFLDHAKSAYLIDQFDVQDTSARLVFASASAGTSHQNAEPVPTQLFPPPFYVSLLSRDLTEALLGFGSGEGLTLGLAQESGTFLPLGGSAGLQDLQLAAPITVKLGGVLQFGPWDQVPLTLDWILTSRSNSPAGSAFKLMGGGTSPAPPIQVSNGFVAQRNRLATSITPDNKELLYSFRNPNDATVAYVIELPDSGHAPPVQLQP